MYNFENNECAIAVQYGPFSKIEVRNLPCYAQEVNKSVTSSWNETTIIGRTGSLVAYTGTSDVRSSFSFDLHREMFIPNTSAYLPENYTDNKIDELIRFINSAVYPLYGNNLLWPARVVWKFGDMYISGRLVEFGAVWKGAIVNKKYSVCTLNVQMVSTDSKIIGYSDIRNNIGTRGHALDADKLGL